MKKPIKRKAKAAVRPRKSSAHASKKTPKGPPKLSPEETELQGKFVEAIDAGESSHWKLGNCGNSYTATLHQGKLQSLQFFYEHYVHSVRPSAPSYVEVALFARVAKVWPESYAALGMSKLSATLALLYFMRVPIPPDPRTAQIPVPTADGGVVTKSFRDCTRDEIQAALDRLKAPLPEPIPPEIRNTAHKLAAALDSVPQHGSAHVQFSLHGPEPTFAFEDIPATRLRESVEALYRALFSG